MNILFIDGHVTAPNNAVRAQRSVYNPAWTTLDPPPVTPPPDALERVFWISQVLLKPQ